MPAAVIRWSRTQRSLRPTIPRRPSSGRRINPVPSEEIITRMARVRAHTPTTKRNPNTATSWTPNPVDGGGAATVNPSLYPRTSYRRPGWPSEFTVTLNHARRSCAQCVLACGKLMATDGQRRDLCAVLATAVSCRRRRHNAAAFRRVWLKRRTTSMSPPPFNARSTQTANTVVGVASRGED